MQLVKVSIAEFIKNFGRLSDRALTDPVTITKNGRDRLIVLSVEEYERLKKRDRRVYPSSDLPDDILEALDRSDDIPEETHAFAHEVKDWKL